MTRKDDIQLFRNLCVSQCQLNKLIFRDVLLIIVIGIFFVKVNIAIVNIITITIISSSSNRSSNTCNNTSNKKDEIEPTPLPLTPKLS